MLKKLLLSALGLLASISMAIAAVNINTATEQELDSLPGVGPAKAKAIIEYRKANGNFKSVDDIKNVKGIGEKSFNDMKGQLSVSGATTTPAAAPVKDKKESAKDAAKEAKADAKAAARETKAEAKAATASGEKKAEKAKEAVKDAASEAKADAKSAGKAAKKEAKSAAAVVEDKAEKAEKKVKAAASSASK